MSTRIVNAYPNSVVWFIEVLDAKGEVTQVGSAVAVCVRSKGDSEPCKMLLTCGHVIRSMTKASPWEDGYGPVVGRIQCYPNFCGHVKPLIATPHTKWSDEIISDVPEEDRRAALDWILLEVQHLSFQDHNCVASYATLPSSSRCRIVGYPGGKAAFHNQIVANTTVEGETPQTPPPPGCIVLVGSDTRAGMSGGGVFNSAGDLVGLHRARLDKALQLYAVSVSHIQAELERRFNMVFVDVSRNAVAGAVAAAFEVTEGVRNLVAAAIGNPELIRDLRASSNTIVSLERQLLALQAAKDAHEVAVHRLGFAIDLIKQGVFSPKPSIGAKHILHLRDGAGHLADAMARCALIYPSGVGETNELVSLIDEVDHSLKNHQPNPFLPLQTFGMSLVNRMGNDLQRGMTAAAKLLPFGELQSAISGLKLEMRDGSPLAGLKKIGSLQEIVRRSVAEHDAWQRLHHNIEILELEIDKLAQQNETDPSFDQVFYTYTHMSKFVAAVTSQKEDASERLGECWTKLGDAISQSNAVAARDSFTDFQNAASILFQKEDELLLKAFEDIAGINTALRTLNELL